jgi:circadian clock protein KaiB
VSGKRGRATLRLYVAGSGPNSGAARANLERILEQDGRRFRVEVVDVLDHPERALRDRVIVTPTLVRPGGDGPVRIIGTLADHDRVRAALGLSR